LGPAPRFGSRPPVQRHNEPEKWHQEKAPNNLLKDDHLSVGVIEGLDALATFGSSR
jgi:hypothetical protein